MPATRHKKAECEKHSAVRAYPLGAVFDLFFAFGFIFLSFFAANSAATAFSIFSTSTR
jgi:hypothetical protein